MATYAAHSGSDFATGVAFVIAFHPPSRTGWPGSPESLIVESRNRQLLSIRLRNQAHPAARNSRPKHRVLGLAIRSSGMPAQTKPLANVLSGEKPVDTPDEWPSKTSSIRIHNFVSGSTIRTGAVFRRLSLSVRSPFPLGVPH